MYFHEDFPFLFDSDNAKNKVILFTAPWINLSYLFRYYHLHYTETLLNTYNLIISKSHWDCNDFLAVPASCVLGVIEQPNQTLRSLEQTRTSRKVATKTAENRSCDRV